MADSSAPETMPQQLQNAQTKRGEQGRKMTEKQRRIAASIRRIEERIAARENLTIEEQIALPLAAAAAEATAKGQKNIDFDTLDRDKQLALLHYLGYEKGLQILAWVQRVAKGAFPIAAPVAAVSALSAHNLALKNPELAAKILAADKIGIVASGLTYLLFQMVRDGYKGRPFLDTAAEALTRKIDEIQQDPEFKIPQKVLFGAACIGGSLALYDPEGAGTTVAPVLSALGTASASHTVTKMLVRHIMEDAGRREEGQLYDDRVVLLSAGIDTVKEITRTIIGNVTDKETYRRLWRSLTGQGSGTHVISVGALENVIDDLTSEHPNDTSRGGQTGRQQQQPHGRVKN